MHEPTVQGAPRAPWRCAIATLAVLGALWAAVPSTAEAAVSSRGETTGSVLGIEMKIEHFTLDNGLRVFVLEDHSKELQKAINQLTVDTVSELATNDGRAHGIAQGALFYDDPVRSLTELESHRKVTPKDIERVAKRYLTDDWLTLEIVPKR